MSRPRRGRATGHVKGAFTDARSDAPGLVASERGGTLFLDEVGEIPIGAQAKLLRFLQEKTFAPVGSTREQAADVRIVSATNRELPKMIARGEFPRGPLLPVERLHGR